MLFPSFWKNINPRIEAYTQSHSVALKQFCDSERASDPHADKNIEWDSLSYVLNVEKRFKTGELFLFYADGEIVAISGYHRSDFDPNTYMFGVRTYTSSRFRFKGVQMNFLMPRQLHMIRAAKARQAIVVFNKHNEKLFKSMQKAKKIFDDAELRALDFRPLPYMIHYKNTDQFGVLVSFDPSYQYSFEGMKAQTANI